MLVFQKTGGHLRICLDPLDLNNDKAPKLSGAYDTRVVCLNRKGEVVLHARRDVGFLQVPLSEVSSFVTTFATPFCRYRYLFLPLDIFSATEDCQQLMLQWFGDLSGIEIYFDDFFVWGETREDHDERLKEVFDRCVQVNFKLNAVSVSFYSHNWIGHIISHQQLNPDPDKIEAIRAFQEPDSKEDLQRLLGVFNYLSKFCQHLSSTTKPLRDLIKHDVE